MFRIKDHIISLVAVFLALGLGILIGTGMSDDMLVTQQRILIDQMTKDYRSLREERLMLEADLQSLAKDIYLWERYQEVLYPGIVSGVLAGSRVAVVSYGAEIPAGIFTMLQDAEAEVCSVIKVNTVPETETSMGSLLATLVRGDFLGLESQEVIDRYQREGLLTIEKNTRNQPDGVILVLGEKGSVDGTVVAQLIAGINLEQLTVVAIEWSNVRESLLGELKKVGISTIDNADSVFGQFSLLAVLRGSAGNYGIKAAADQFIATF